MSRTYKDGVLRKATELYNAWGGSLNDLHTPEYREMCDYWVHVVLNRKLRHGNKRKLMARLKVQKRRRARRELEREVLDARSYDVCWSEDQYSHECRYIYDTVYDYAGLHHLSFEDCGFILWPDDILPEDVLHEHDDDDDMAGYLYQEDDDHVVFLEEACDYHDGFTPMIDEEGYAYYWDHTPSHSNAKPHDFSRGVSLGELLMSKLR